MFFRRNTTTKASRGAQAEARAEKFLQARGLTRCTQNYRCKEGEIDLIMREADTLVFVEVRLRTNPRFEQAAASVDSRKQRKVVKAAQHYLLEQQLTDKLPCRFDVIALSSTDDTDIEWIPNAFYAS